MIKPDLKPGDQVTVIKVSSSQQFSNTKKGTIIRYAHAGFYWVSVDGKELSLRRKWMVHDQSSPEM